MNLLAFAAAAALVWAAGTRLSRYASTIAERTGIGAAVIGIVLLGGITSLPELAVSVTAGLSGSAALAVNNLLGGVAMQVAIIAIADAVLGDDAISSVTARPVVLLQATLGILLLSLFAAGVVVGDVSLGFVGVWSTAILLGYIGSVRLIQVYQKRPTWVAAEEQGEQHGNGDGEREPAPDRKRLGRIYARTGVAALTILAAGFVLARTGEAIAAQTGLGQSFVGAVLVAISTSLPEVSTVVSAVRLHEYELAFSDIFGTNLVDIALIFLVDAAYPGPPVLDLVGDFSLVAAVLGIAVTALYAAGLIERRDRTLFRLGYDSVAVLLVYFGGLYLLYTLR